MIAYHSKAENKLHIKGRCLLSALFYICKINMLYSMVSSGLCGTGVFGRYSLGRGWGDHDFSQQGLWVSLGQILTER